MEENKTEKLSRRQLRQHTFSLIYNLGFYTDEDFEQAAGRYLRSNEINDADDAAQIKETALAVMTKRSSYDSMIDERGSKWKSNRIAKVDLAIIRLALYEIYEDDEVSTAIAIDEAVRLAKKYSSDKSPSFINGLLAQIIKADIKE